MAVPTENKNATQARGGNQNHSYVSDKFDTSNFPVLNQFNFCFEPQYDIAQKFLCSLDEEAESFTFQTFDDDSKRKNPRLAKVLHGSLQEHMKELTVLQNEGAGVFVTVNETNLKGRTAENILRVRALFVDLDGTPLESLDRAPIAPHMIIESSPGRFHAYWFITDCPLERFSEIQKKLAPWFGGDQKVIDKPRVMRLPGFYHQKGEPFLTRVLEDRGVIPIAFEDFEKAFQFFASSNESGPTDQIYEILNKRKMIKKQDLRLGCYSIKCPWEHEHSSEDLGTKYYLAGHNGYDKPGFQCFHDHCKKRTIVDLREFLGIANSTNSSSFSAAHLESIEWSIPSLIEAELYPVPSFETAILLPPVLGDWIMDEADRMPCPPDFIAAPAIAALGILIGARCAVRPKEFDDWLVVPNLWGGNVGLPASKKSPAMSVALVPLERVIRRDLKAYQDKLTAYEIQETVFEAKSDAFVAKIKVAVKNQNGDVDTPALDLQKHKENPPLAPAFRRYKTNDTTIEKLGELLRENPNGIMIVRDELVGLFASWDKEGREGDRSFFLESWNGTSSFDTDRIKRGSILIPNLCTSIFGGIQPDKLTVYLEQASNALSNDGLLQRFQMLVYPDQRQWRYSDRQPNQQFRDKIFALFEVLADFEPLEWGAQFGPNVKFPYFGFDAEAQEVYIDWAMELHQERIPKEELSLMQQHLAKYDKLFPALALVFHLVDCAFSGMRGLIRKESALRARSWCLYLEDHARRCYGLLADDGLRAAQALAKKLEQGKLKDKFTARDLKRNQWRYLKTDDASQAALDWLEDEGWLRSFPVGGTGPGTGRPTIRYLINPKIVKEPSQEERDDHDRSA